MNGRFIWKQLKTHWLTGSLALALGLTSSAAAQYPETLPPIPTPKNLQPVPGATAPIRGQPVSLQEGAVQKELPKEIKQEVPPPTPALGPVEMPAPGCSTCGTGRRGCGGGGCGSCGTGGGYGCACVGYPCGFHGCFPGHFNCCDHCNHDGPLGRFFCCFYECLCCPDPCYEPCYRIEANSAFWVDGARPVTMTRIRWDSGRNFTQPDRSEFFWASSGKNRRPAGAPPFAAGAVVNPIGKGPEFVETSMKYDSLYFYQEAAVGKASAFVEMEYRTVDPDVNKHTSGFGDTIVGTKALLFDCELTQLTFQFKTYILSGIASKGLGTGHVSLEPSLLWALKLLPETYLQAQVAEWIPLGGDPHHMGSVLHYHFSLNHVLWRPLNNVPLIGLIEANGYSFQDGLYTDSVFGLQTSGGDTWWSAGPGLRLSICDKIDLGASAMFGLTDGIAEQTYRSELRLRF